MRSKHSSKSAQITSRLISNFKESLTTRSKHNKQKSTEPADQIQVKNNNLLAIIKEKNIDQWIFGDQKIKINCQNKSQNFPIRARIAFNRKERLSKHTFIEVGNQPKTKEQHQAQINCLQYFQSQQETKNHKNQVKRQQSRPIINEQQDNKIQQPQINISKQFNHRYSHNTYSAIRNIKHINTSMEIYSDLTHFLKPTAFSIQLKKPLQQQQRARSPYKDRMNKTITCNKYKNIMNIVLRRQNSVRTALQKKVEPSRNIEKQKYLLNGWEVESSMFNDFDQLYRQKSKQQLDKQQNTIKAKIVRLSMH